MIEHTRLINTQFTSNTYILSIEGEKSVWIVDPGDVQPIFDWMRLNNKGLMAGIMLTHAHFDHIYGINELLEKFPKSPVYVANEYGKSLLFDEKKNNSYFAPTDNVVIKPDAQIEFFPSAMSLWPNVTLNVFHTPGHSEDSVCLQVDDLLFTGDTLIHNLRTVTKLRGGDTVKLNASLELLKTLSDKGLHVCPGHGEEFELDGYDLRKALRAEAPKINLSAGKNNA